MSGSLATPQISVLIPTFERASELRLCLEGFRKQTLAAENFEVIVVDDGSSCELQPVIAGYPELRIEFRKSEHQGASVARNLALDLAQAPWLLLYDDDLQPLPGLLDYCVAFHRRHPGDGDAALLYFTPDPSRCASAFEQWAFPRLYPFPLAAGWYDWNYFWSGSITCKRQLLAGCRFNLRYEAVEDADLGFRLHRRSSLRVHFEPVPVSLFSRQPTFDELCGRQRRMGYYRFLLAAEHTGRLHYPHPVYARPEEYLVKDRRLLNTARALASRNPGSPSATASLLWSQAENNAIATGWLAARQGVPLDALDDVVKPSLD